MSHQIPNLVNGSIPALFGNGLLGHSMTGLIRIPAFMANCTAVMMTGELAIRGLSSTLSAIGFNPSNESWLQKAANHFENIRPYKDAPAKELAVKMVALAALGVIGSEFVRIAGGPAPAIYNNILSVLGPIRIDTGAYLDNITPLLESFQRYFI